MLDTFSPLKIMVRGCLKSLFFGCLFLAISTGGLAREITDMSGRRVRVPEVITKAYGASPPATYLIYAINPSLLAGFNYPLFPEEMACLDPSVQKLPVIGGWFGQGRTPNQEALLKVKPDIMIVWMWKESAVNQKIEQTAEKLGLPMVYIIVDRLEDYPKAFSFLGELLGKQERGKVLNEYASQAISHVRTVVSEVPQKDLVPVYYAEGSDGLYSECDHSLHAELIGLAGGKNICRCQSENPYGMERISVEQIMLGNPAVIIAQEKIFADHVESDPLWQSVSAVKNHRVYSIPRYPLNWFDRPPSFMRLLGVQWLTHVLHPQKFPWDTESETRFFYQLFLNVELDETAAKKVLFQ